MAEIREIKGKILIVDVENGFGILGVGKHHSFRYFFALKDAPDTVGIGDEVMFVPYATHIKAISQK